MRVIATELSEVLIIETELFADDRGCFSNIFLERFFSEQDIDFKFVQDSYSRSKQHTVRGLHFQSEPHAQGKLVTVLTGEIWDVVLDIRPTSPNFGKWASVDLSADRGRMLWIPPGFAHGFQATSEVDSVVLYKLTDYWTPGSEGTVRWDDPDININWPLSDPLVSNRDAGAPTLAQFTSHTDLQYTE